MVVTVRGKTRGAWVPSPLRWPGGKSRLRARILELFPHPASYETYVEPFAGAAWVFFAKERSGWEVLSDRDGELVNFLCVVRDQPGPFLASFEWELCSRAEFTRLAALDPAGLSEVERAHRFYYLVMAGWGGEWKYPRFQHSVADAGHGNRLIGALQNLPRRILPASERLQGVGVEVLDWRACLDRYDVPGTLAYLDPPYPGNGVNYACNMRPWELHVALARRLASARCRWVLSSYDHPRIHALFAGCGIYPVQFFSGLKERRDGGACVKNREVLVTNIPPEYRR